ncbi:MAG: MFS transporter, partial [Chloroflexota bacterium]
GLTGPVGGYLVDRYGPRLIVLISVILMGLGFIALSQVQSLIAFYAIYILFVAMGASTGIAMAMPTAIANWFIRKRSRAMGILYAGVGMGGVAVPVLALLISAYGWRTALVIIGALVIIVFVPLSFVFRQRPEQYGMMPDGESPATPATTVVPNEKKAKDAEIDFTPRQALRTPSFWLISIAFAMRTTASHGVPLHLMPHLQGQGFSTEAAALALGALGVASVVGRLGFSWLGDFWEKRHVLFGSTMLMSVGLIFLNLPATWTTVALFLLIYAPGYGGAPPLTRAIFGEYYGRKHYGTISGFFSVIIMVGTVGGPLFAGYMYDTSKSYTIAFYAFAVANTLGAALIFLAKRPKPPVAVAQARAGLQ